MAYSAFHIDISFKIKAAKGIAMAPNLIADFFSLINVSLFNYASMLLIICFIIWEIPRSVKIISREYTEGLYPEGGRVADFVLLIIGLGSVHYYLTNSHVTGVVSFLKAPGITSFFLIVMAVVSLIIFLGFLKRLFERTEGKSITVFLAQAFLDLMHTIFYICLTILVVPIVGYLLFGGLVR